MTINLAHEVGEVASLSDAGEGDRAGTQRSYATWRPDRSRPPLRRTLIRIATQSRTQRARGVP